MCVARGKLSGTVLYSLALEIYQDSTGVILNAGVMDPEMKIVPFWECRVLHSTVLYMVMVVETVKEKSSGAHDLHFERRYS